jgi:hypothetical protein
VFPKCYKILSRVGKKTISKRRKNSLLRSQSFPSRPLITIVSSWDFKTTTRMVCKNQKIRLPSRNLPPLAQSAHILESNRSANRLKPHPSVHCGLERSPALTYGYTHRSRLFKLSIRLRHATLRLNFICNCNARGRWNWG